MSRSRRSCCEYKLFTGLLFCSRHVTIINLFWCLLQLCLSWLPFWWHCFDLILCEYSIFFLQCTDVFPSEVFVCWVSSLKKSQQMCCWRRNEWPPLNFLWSSIYIYMPIFTFLCVSSMNLWFDDQVFLLKKSDWWFSLCWDDDHLSQLV